MQTQNKPEMPADATGQGYLGDLSLAELIARFCASDALRQVEYKALEPFDSPTQPKTVHLIDHVTDRKRYNPRDISAKSFRHTGEVSAYFAPLEAANPAYKADKLRLLQAVCEMHQAEQKAKLDAGYFEAEANYEQLGDMLDVLEQHICDVPCRSLADVREKIRFALWHLKDEGSDWSARDDILKSAFDFLQHQPVCTPDDTGLQLAALLSVAADQMLERAAEAS